MEGYGAGDDVLILGNLLPRVLVGEAPLTDSVSQDPPKPEPEPSFYGHCLANRGILTSSQGI